MYYTNYTIIYKVGTVYFCPSNPSNTISMVALKCYVSFQKVTSDPLEYYDFVEPQGSS